MRIKNTKIIDTSWFPTIIDYIYFDKEVLPTNLRKDWISNGLGKVSGENGQWISE